MSIVSTQQPSHSLQSALFATSFEMRLTRALHHLRIGRPIILMDDYDRENEADLIVAADKLTVPVMAQLILDGSGIVCLCLPDAAMQALHLPPMVSNNESRHSTAFTISIEARENVSTGVSAADRVTTIRAALTGKVEAIVSPGHVFPLRAQTGGVLTRRGHTEGSVDLAVLAGQSPAGVLCELMNPDGTMMRGAALERYAIEHGLTALTIAELADYRQQRETHAHVEQNTQTIMADALI